LGIVKFCIKGLLAYPSFSPGPVPFSLSSILLFACAFRYSLLLFFPTAQS
jgi:hypothetical protein